ncbi:MAG: hypothetical protein KDE53_29580 [Caldilineaceae bacterium]|nr:hypothetical protein [Caldilineaceae bacterium]
MQHDTPRVRWQERASIWLGIGINPASISTGGGIAMMVPPRHLAWVLPLGISLLLAISIAQGLMGQRRRARLAQVAVTTFGRTGAMLLNLLMAIGLVGWSGFHGGVSGASLAELLHVPGWLGALLIITLLYLLNRWGINRWAALTWVTTGAALALTIFALSTVDLAGAAFAMRAETAVGFPNNQALSASGVLLAIGTIIGYATLFSLRTPDFTWDFADTRDVLKANLFLFLPLLFAMSVGAVLYHATGNWNIAEILAQNQSATLGHLFLIVAVVSPLISGWYSGAFALSYLTPLRPNQSILLICVLGFFLAATRFDQQLLPFLGYLGAALGPALVLILLTQWQRRQPPTTHAFLAWLAGAALALLLQAQGFSLHLFAGSALSVCTLAISHLYTKHRHPRRHQTHKERRPQKRPFSQG